MLGGEERPVDDKQQQTAVVNTALALSAPVTEKSNKKHTRVTFASNCRNKMEDWKSKEMEWFERKKKNIRKNPRERLMYSLAHTDAVRLLDTAGTSN
ncbi:hypothetical protein E6O75_ATG04833 [Venturia nashicola]|uniref:Uncharacterized protein n=1 Tax=Venturia nashicola TaxID=86259 RepID=A0A4Z1NYT2_9PEZI|nr:hypothetical protein E6O75_ATG04833 [Venturia nashicola]